MSQGMMNATVPGTRIVKMRVLSAIIASAACNPQHLGLGRQRRFSFLVALAVAALERTTRADVHALHGPPGGRDLARARRPHRDPAHRDARLDTARWDATPRDERQ